ncbi:MAG TPA: hypothetical protein DCM87_14855 [Planctomycetes bacterium]|nr:hypothetical protein [Planctomycetota bacterium]
MTAPLRVAILHYHLRPGGVTQVIAGAVRALAGRDVRVAVLAGAPPDARAGIEAPVAVVPGLGYATRAAPAPPPERLAAALADAARGALEAAPDVWHVHNHSLGKNCALPRALARMIAGGARVLLQIHDFPEDGRAENYRALRRDAGDGGATALAGRLYPRAPHVHYAVLNRRDRDLLLGAGAGAARVHLLPNPVSVEEPSEPEGPAAGEGLTFLYPTRAIRRKNLGEFLLWAAAARRGERFGVTLAPASPAEAAPYARWTALARELRLPVQFELGARPGATLRRLVGTCACAVTTSVAEGFGLAFLEPWLAGRPVAGRNLPEITADFAQEGIALDGLYERLEIPADWVDAGKLRGAIEAALRATYAAYKRTPPADAAARAHRAIVANDMADFGRLDQAAQAAVVRRVASCPAAAEAFRPRELRIAGAGVVARNRARIAERFSIPAYGRALEAIYRAAAAESPGGIEALDAGALLDGFLAPERLFLSRF